MSDRTDIIFDRIADTFAQEIYGTTKGDVRLHVLWHDMCTEIPVLSDGGLRVIDIGAGMGQIARRVAELSHEVTLCDPSHDMLEKARASIKEAGLTDAVQFVQAKAQELRERVIGQFDVVICHAILEWLAEPKETISDILPLLRPDGYLSLMFYNRNAAILKRILRGDFLGAFEKNSNSADSQSPIPLDPDEVQSWLVKSGLRVLSRAGIRIFHDHLPEPLRKSGKLEELVWAEIEFRKQEPFASLGQHIHFVCRWK